MSGKHEFGGMVDFGIVNASCGTCEVRTALVVGNARNDKERLEYIRYIVVSFKLFIVFCNIQKFVQNKETLQHYHL